jgi:head-tail adaptor
MDDLAAMRDAVRGLLTEAATVLRQTRTPDGAGGYRETWAAVGTYPCRLAPAGLMPREEQGAGQVMVRGQPVATLPVEADVTPRDRVQIGSLVWEIVGLERRAPAVCVRAVLAEPLP